MLEANKSRSVERELDLGEYWSMRLHLVTVQ